MLCNTEGAPPVLVIGWCIKAYTINTDYALLCICDTESSRIHLYERATVVLAHVRFISLRDLPLLYDITEGLGF